MKSFKDINWAECVVEEVWYNITNPQILVMNKKTNVSEYHRLPSALAKYIQDKIDAEIKAERDTIGRRLQYFSDKLKNV